LPQADCAAERRSAKPTPVQKPIEEPPRSPWGRTADVDEHISQLRAEFIGLPETCHEHAALVVRIRRKIDLESTLGAFFALWASDAEQLASNLSSRWLVSACDTFADYGTPFQRAAALMLSATINTLKLAETERLLMSDASLDLEKTERLIRTQAGQTHVPLWDGMTAYSIEAGDMPRNLLSRMRSVLSGDPALSAIGAALIERALQGDTVFGRLSKRNPRFWVPRTDPS
jgi:hypothetical protein